MKRVLIVVLLLGGPVGCDQNTPPPKAQGTKKKKKNPRSAPDAVSAPNPEVVAKKAAKAEHEREERIDTAYSRCLVRFGMGTCRLIEQRGIERCYRPEMKAEDVKACFAKLLKREYVEDYVDDCYPHVIGCAVGSESCPEPMPAEVEETKGP